MKHATGQSGMIDTNPMEEGKIPDSVIFVTIDGGCPVPRQGTRIEVSWEGDKKPLPHPHYEPLELWEVDFIEKHYKPLVDRVNDLTRQLGLLCKD